MHSFYADSENENSSEKDDLLLEPAAEDMDDKTKFPSGASMPVTDLYRRKHKTDSKSNAPLSVSQTNSSHQEQLNVSNTPFIENETRPLD